MDIKLEKKKIRKEVLERRKALSEDERFCAEQDLLRAISQHPFYLEAESILAFASYGTEINLFPLLEYIWETGKKVYLPLTLPDMRILFYQVNGLDDCISGYHGILEPKPDVNRLFSIDESKKAMMIMPGVAFDQKGHRMGYGGGCYDRFLSQYPGLLEKSIAVGFRCQMVASVPVEDTDLSPTEILLF